VTVLDSSSGGDRLAGAGKDAAVRIWDLLTGQEVLTLPGHTEKPFRANEDVVAIGGNGVSAMAFRAEQSTKCKVRAFPLPPQLKTFRKSVSDRAGVAR
jgi:WD40 repeat protein